MCECINIEQTIEVEQVYGVIGYKDIPQEIWDMAQEEYWNGNTKSK